MPASDSFVTHARRFCEFIERASELPVEQRLLTARAILLELYPAALRLPLLESPDGVEAGPDPDPPRGWDGFGELDSYWEVFDPYEQSEAVTGSLSDDLLDVYRDLRRGLALWDGGAPRAAAVWEWRFSFEAHWGDHVVDALRALHRACKR